MALPLGSMAPVGATESSTPSPGTGSDPDPAPDTGAGPPDPAPEDPLRVKVESLRPSVMPQRGRIRVAGEILNRSSTTWTDLTVYLVVSRTPLTSAAEVEEAVASDPRTDVGDRIVEPGSYVEVDDLAPGERTSFRLAVRRDQLAISGEPGVYWLAVHVLGSTDEGRLEGADGRSRTFLPLVPDSAATELAVALQVRRGVRRDPDGRLEDVEDWARALSGRGRLRQIVGLGRTAGTWPVSWVVDRAVVDAAGSLAAGNPAWQLDAEPGRAEQDRKSGAGSGGDQPADGEPGEDGEPVEAPPGGAAQAAAWLDAAVPAFARRGVLALPFGDLDTAAAVRHGGEPLLVAALDAGAARFEEISVRARPLLADPVGFVAPKVLEVTEAAVPAVVVPDAVAGAATDSPTDDVTVAAPRCAVCLREDGGRIVVTPDARDLEGPGPSGARSALGLRQRLLADAAVHALSGADAPLVRLTPPLWNPGDAWRSAEFFAGLDVPWLSGVSLEGLLDRRLRSATPADTGGSGGQAVRGGPDAVSLDYPQQAREAELPRLTVRAAERLASRAGTLAAILVRQAPTTDQVTEQALTTASVWDRRRPRTAALRATLATDTVNGWLDRIQVRAPAFVTLSSDSGTFQVSVLNGLRQPVTIGLEVVVTGDSLEMVAPRTVRLPPRSRRAVAVEAIARDIGVHRVTVQPVAGDGTTVGRPATLDIRTSQVGLILWVVMGVGTAILLVAIAVRILRRVRRRQRTHGPLLDRPAP